MSKLSEEKEVSWPFSVCFHLYVGFVAIFGSMRMSKLSNLDTALTNRFVFSILKTQRALPVDGWPQVLLFEVTAKWGLGGYFFFATLIIRVANEMSTIIS